MKKIKGLSKENGPTSCFFVNQFIKLSFNQHLIISFVVHLGLILFCEIQDYYFEVKYTDIDYVIFSDAAKLIWNGSSPFDRPTYRYTPFLAWMLLLNVTWFPQFGKVLFSLFDIFCGLILFKILPKHLNPKPYIIFLWLYNPLSLIISTRGSCESIISTLVLLVIYKVEAKQYLLGGFLYGLAIHFKIYPVIFAPTFYLALSGKSKKNLFWSNIMPNKARLIFGGSMFLGFVIPTALAYYLYGNIYLNEAWLYHLYRQDLQHNFSPYFYLYQVASNEAHRKILSMLAFLPQLVLIMLSTLHYNYSEKRASYRWLTLFIQSFVFVTLNKVITCQYFEWYVSLLPLVAPYLKMHYSTSFKITIIWAISILQWLLPAYLYEFKKWDCFHWLGLASVAYVLLNLSLLEYIRRKFVVKQKGI